MGHTSAWLVALALQAAAGASTPASHTAASEPAASEPASSEPAATEPTATEPTATEPTASDLASSEPASDAPTATAPASTAPASTAPTAPAAHESPPAPGRPPRTYPRVVIAGGPIVGPHAFGNEECKPELGRCETKGSFLGLGGQVEARVRLWRMIQAHARGLAVGNVSPNDPIHRGLWGLGVGAGVQGRRAFGRAEYLWLSTFGDAHFEPPFFEGEVATDRWGHHAGMVSVGFRQPLPHRLAAELWGGLVIGPRSVRTVPDTQPDERVLTTFLVGLNVSWDAWP